jgi:hypothetical protein
MTLLAFLLLFAFAGLARWWVTPRLMRVPQIWIRVPLWLLWFPMETLVEVSEELFAGAWRRIASEPFWRWRINAFFVGLFGTLVGMEITR